MKLKTYIALPLLAVMALASCADNNDMPEIKGHELNVKVTDRGYADSRATDAGLVTEFAAGDKIGVFAVTNGKIDSKINNMCLTAVEKNGELTWEADEEGKLYEVPGAKYFAYYPYTAAMPAQPNASGVDAAAFFAPVAEAWMPQADQSDHQAYTSSDLMTASASVSEGSLNFSMSHRMALLLINFPRLSYEFTNTPALPEYVLATSEEVTVTGYQPYVQNDGTCRLLVNPAQKPSLEGSYKWEGTTREWNFTANPVAGTANTYTIDRKFSDKISHNLQVGDFFLSDGRLLSKDTPADKINDYNIVGIVFNIDPERIGDAEKKALNNKVHGTVLALKDVTKPYQVGCWSTQKLDETTIGIPNLIGTTAEETLKMMKASVSGLSTLQKLLASRTELLTQTVYEMHIGAADYMNTDPDYSLLKSRTTGWYMPAGGQWLDIIQNLGKVDLTQKPMKGKVVDMLYWMEIEGILSNINSSWASVDQSMRTDLAANRWYWTSEASSPDNAYYLQITDGGRVNSVSIFANSKTQYGYCKAVLVF